MTSFRLTYMETRAVFSRSCKPNFYSCYHNFTETRKAFSQVFGIISEAPPPKKKPKKQWSIFVINTIPLYQNCWKVSLVINWLDLNELHLKICFKFSEKFSNFCF